MLRQGWCRFGGICGRLPVPSGKPDGLGLAGAAFGLVVSPAQALCVAVYVFRAILGAPAGRWSRRVCVFHACGALDETYWRCWIHLAVLERRSICNIDNFPALCKNKAYKKHSFLQQSHDQKYGDILEILLIDSGSNFEALWSPM